MDDIDGRLALKVLAALVASLDQHEPTIIDRMRDTLANAAPDPIGDIALGAVEAVIEARSSIR